MFKKITSLVDDSSALAGYTAVWYPVGWVVPGYWVVVPGYRVVVPGYWYGVVVPGWVLGPVPSLRP